MILFRVCIVAASPYKLFYLTTNLSNVEFSLLVGITLLIAAGGYIINDIFDVEIDMVNKPKQQIIGKNISESEAYRFYKIVSAIAVVAVFVLAFSTRNFRLSMLPLIIMVILNFYAHTFKKQLLVGNFMIALTTAFTIWLITLFEASGNENASDLQTQVQSGIAIAGFVYGLFAFLCTFLREIVKDMEDIEGDRLGNCKTIPIVFGLNKSKFVTYLISAFILFILVIFVFFFPTIQLKINSIFIVFGLILPLIFINIFIFLAKTPDKFHFISNLIKFFMLLGIATMLYFRSGIGPYIFMQFANFIEKLV